LRYDRDEHEREAEAPEAQDRAHRRNLADAPDPAELVGPQPATPRHQALWTQTTISWPRPPFPHVTLCALCAPRDSNPEPAESCRPVSALQWPSITAGQTGCRVSHRQPPETCGSPFGGQFGGQTSGRSWTRKSSTRRPARRSWTWPEAIAAASSVARMRRRLRFTRAQSWPRVLPGCSATS